ncbi:methyl-accepting chemotaxis protein [Halobacteroides halobius DSM 5150]|uniref:Methyl-accepting chemotaxis protein n=1 Tax=Halobacteroides halobius (strain ATCC 35273 / DSM 5150 / MD-1) TaxID=748449 RepID=L0K816_HALHC|nr:methyl-accepting chemotaxis protein [Halobacteroides halobius]AGB40690.1 methyl-accepting chemotaxis protein [Halobacteroides halobius DSM 5150]
MLSKLNLKQKLMISMIALAVIPVLISGIISYTRNRNLIKEQVIKENELLANQLAKRVQEKMSVLTKTVNVIADLEGIESMKNKKHQQIFNKFKQKYPIFQYLYVTNEEGQLITFSADTDQLGNDFSHRSWFKGAMRGYSYISNAHISTTTKSLCLTISTPIKNNNGQITGVLGADISLMALQSMVTGVKLGQAGQVYLTDSQGVVIVHPNYKDMVLKQVKKEELKPVQKALAGKVGTITYVTNKGTEMLATYEPLQRLNWALVAQQPTGVAFKVLKENLFSKLLTILVATLLAVGISTWLAHNFSQPILKLVGAMRQKARGDLTVDLNLDRDDELGMLANTFSQGTEQHRKLVSDLLDTIDNLSAYSEELSASAEEGNAIIEANDQNLSEVSAGVEQISASSQEVSGLAQEANSQTKIGSQNIQETVSSMEEINQAVEETVKVLNSLDNKSQQISKIVELIQNIAEQTNLLALNAAIEAARADSTSKNAGQGFAVVADEIRELAEETAQATNQIEDLIKETQDKSSAGLESINQVEAKVKEGKEVAQETGAVFDEIEAAIENTSSQMEEIAVVAQELAQNSEQAKSASQEINSMSDEITNSSQELAQMAEKLQGLVAKFKVEQS